MHKSLTRTVVNLSLVAVMAIQPVAVVFALGPCGKSGSQCSQSVTKCSGCRCCEVSVDGELCGCCSEPAASHSCCGEAEPSVSPKMGSAEVDPLADEGSRDVPVGKGEPAQKKMESPAKAVQVAACTCGLHSEPVVPAPVRVPTYELREIVVIALLSDRDLVGAASAALQRHHQMVAFAQSSLHFSQRNLCVWRL